MAYNLCPISNLNSIREYKYVSYFSRFQMMEKPLKPLINLKFFMTLMIFKNNGRRNVEILMPENFKPIFMSHNRDPNIWL